ncbi:hypothetical protein ACFX13_015676 [Malus domestica]
MKLSKGSLGSGCLIIVEEDQQELHKYEPPANLLVISFEAPLMFLTWCFLFASQLTGFRLHRCFNSGQVLGNTVQEEQDEEPACPTLIQEAELADPPGVRASIPWECIVQTNVIIFNEGIKFLNTWLEGERLIGFCKYLGKNIQSLNQMKFLTCASLEISSSSKRRLPKLIYAKTLRIVVQQAEDDKILNDANMVHSYDGLLWTLRSLQELSSVLLLPDPKLKKLSDSSPSNELSWLSMEWSSILERTQLHRNLLEPFIAFRRVLLQISSCRDCATSSAGSRFSQAAAALHEFKWLSVESGLEGYRLEEAKLLRGQGQHEMAFNGVMQQFFGLVNTFLQNHQDTWKRRLGVRTYKVVPFTPSAGVLEWVNGTLPLGEYLTGSTRNGRGHGRYGVGDWSFLKCREHMANGKDSRKFVGSSVISFLWVNT